MQWVRDLTSILDLRFLEFDERALDITIGEFGGEKLVLPARLFPGADVDQPAIPVTPSFGRAAWDRHGW